MMLPKSLAFADKSSWRESLVGVYREHEEMLGEYAYGILRDHVEADKVISDAFSVLLLDASMTHMSGEDLKRKLFELVERLAKSARRRARQRALRLLMVALAAIAIGLLCGLGPEWFPEYAGLIYGLTAVFIGWLFCYACKCHPSRNNS